MSLHFWQAKNAAVLLLLVLGYSHMANSIEEPQYTPLATLGSIEIRRYQASHQAVTAMSSQRDSSSGFRRLASYIFGGNSAGQKIAMTAPVAITLAEPTPEMAFTLPARWQLTSLPEPRDPRVRLRALPAYTAAVLAFSGRATDRKTRQQYRQLETALAAQGINMIGTPVLNQYNPPWTLPFLRRNEIQVAVEWPSPQSTAASPHQSVGR